MDVSIIWNLQKFYLIDKVEKGVYLPVVWGSLFGCFCQNNNLKLKISFHFLILFDTSVWEMYDSLNKLDHFRKKQTSLGNTGYHCAVWHDTVRDDVRWHYSGCSIFIVILSVKNMPSMVFS